MKNKNLSLLLVLVFVLGAGAIAAQSQQGNHMAFESSDAAGVLNKDESGSHVDISVFRGKRDDYVWHIEDYGRNGEIDYVKDGYSEDTLNVYRDDYVRPEQQEFFNTGTIALLEYASDLIEDVVSSDPETIVLYRPPSRYEQRFHMVIQGDDIGPFVLKGVLRDFEVDTSAVIRDTESLPGVSLECTIPPRENPSHPLEAYRIEINAIRLRKGPLHDIVRELVSTIQNHYQTRRSRSQESILEDLSGKY